MFKYIQSAVSIENLRNQFAEGMSVRTFIELVNIDPTANLQQDKGGKYCPWIFRQYNAGNLGPENYANLKDALSDFARSSAKYQYSDLGRYKTVEEFLQDSERVGNMPLTEKEKAKQLKKSAHKADDADKKFIASSGDWELWTPLTYEGSISLARTGGEKASWCTAYEGRDGYYVEYSSQGPLYIFLNTKNPGEKYQVHFQSHQFCDIDDRNLGMSEFYKFIGDKPEFQEAFGIYSINNEIFIRNNVVFATKAYIKEADLTQSPIRIDGVGGGSFSGDKTLTKVILPDTVTKIGGFAFWKCASLETINIPDSVQEIEEYAFGKCRKLSPESKASIEAAVARLGLNIEEILI